MILLVQLGANHVSVILSHRRDSITSVWYYVSHRRDTSFLACVTHRKKYLWVLLSSESCNSIWIFSKISIQNSFREQKFSHIFWNLDICKLLKYHVSVILSQRRDTLNFSLIYSITVRWYYHVCVIVSWKRDLALTE